MKATALRFKAHEYATTLLPNNMRLLQAKKACFTCTAHAPNVNKQLTRKARIQLHRKALNKNLKFEENTQHVSVKKIARKTHLLKISVLKFNSLEEKKSEKQTSSYILIK